MAFYNSINDPTNFTVGFTENPVQDFGVFAKGYWQAANALVKELVEKPHFLDYEAYPIVFLYRHAFELYLKNIFFRSQLLVWFKSLELLSEKNIFHHDLISLSELFKNICEIYFPEEGDLNNLATKTLNIAKEFQGIDKNSHSYRYPIGKNWERATKKRQLVNLRAFSRTMDELLTELDVVNLGLDIELSIAQEAFESYQNKINMLTNRGLINVLKK